MNNHAGIVAVLGILIFLVLIPLAILNGTTGFIPELFVFISLTLFFYWFFDVWRLSVPVFALLIVGMLSHAAGVFGWYHVSPVPIQWDHVSHFFALLPFSLLFFGWLEQWMDSGFSKKNLLLILAVFLMSSGIGAVIELSEFVGYLKLGFGDGALQFGPGDGVGDEVFNSIGGGWVNTGWDLVYNTAGIVFGLVVCLVSRALMKKHRKAYCFEEVGEWSRRIR